LALPFLFLIGLTDPPSSRLAVEELLHWTTPVAGPEDDTDVEEI
jgi:hypothetical protein